MCFLIKFRLKCQDYFKRTKNLQKTLQDLQNCADLASLEKLRVATLGKKGFLTLEFAKLKELQGEAKKELAAKLNTQKANLTKLTKQGLSS